MRCSMQRVGGLEQQLHRHCRPLQGSKRQQRLRHRAHDAVLPLDTAASLTALVEHHSATAAAAPSSQHAALDLPGRGIPQHQGHIASGPEAAGQGLLLPQGRHQLLQQQDQQHLAVPASTEQPSPQSAETHHQLPSGRRTILAATHHAATQQQLAAGLPHGQRQQQQLPQPPVEQQQLLRRRRHQHTAPPARGVGAQFKQQLPAPPLKYPPTGRGQALKQASAMAKHIRCGRHVLLPAGSGMQLARGLSALATARTLLLSHSSATGLAFQPSFAAQQQQQQGATSAPHADAGTASGGRIMMLVTGLPESQLRRFNRQPLVASRHGKHGALAAAAFARLCRQGFTSIRAAGPDAARVALMAAAEARRKLLGCGLDLAVVPAEEATYGERQQQQYQGQQQQQQSQYQSQYAGDDVGYAGGGHEQPVLVRTTVLHLVRCEPQQPWKLLPWPVAAEQQPAVQWLRQQQAGAQLGQQGAELAEAPPPQQQQQWEEEDVQQPTAVQSVLPQTSLLRVVANCLEPPTPELGSSPGGPDATGSSSSSGGAGAVLDALHVAAAAGARRQPGALLLQKQSKGKRQLVAAAQGPGAC